MASKAYISIYIGLLCCAFCLTCWVTQGKDDRMFIEGCHVTEDLWCECSSRSRCTWRYTKVHIWKSELKLCEQVDTPKNELVSVKRWDMDTYHMLQTGWSSPLRKSCSTFVYQCVSVLITLTLSSSLLFFLLLTKK